MPVEIKEPVELLTVQECAEELGVIPRRVLQFIEEGRLPANKIGRPWFIRREDLEAFKKIPRKPGNLTGKSRLVDKKK
ncbi:MAG: helix-turn-helix domain-containing protein [candidate division Zixibacteria bacterium]|nr:helix-turn-helix domain-containing protein [candidate division Zixibacteria bacterium]